MGRGAGNDFEHALFAQRSKLGQQIAAPDIDKEPPALAKMLEIEFREWAQLLVVSVPLEFTIREFDQEIDLSNVAFL